MRTLRTLTALAILTPLLVASARAQRETAPRRMLAAFQAEILTRYDPERPKNSLPLFGLPDGWAATDRVSDILSATLTGIKIVCLDNNGKPILYARGTDEQLENVQSLLNEMAKDHPVHARLQCSLVTLPLAAAKRFGLEPNVVIATDGAAFSRLVRHAAKHKGTLQNLPEHVAAPLAPFHIAPISKPVNSLWLRGEMVPFSSTEVVIAMQLLNGSPPAVELEAPTNALVHAHFRLTSGASAIVMGVESGTATVLMVRCVATSHEGPKAPTGK